MQEKYKHVIKNYFSDLIAWLLGVTFLMFVSLTAALVFQASNPFVWVIPAAFGIIYLFSLPLFILHIKVRTDIRKKAIQKTVLQIADLQTDDKFMFKNRGGAIAGKVKYRIFDEENNSYLLCASDERIPILACPSSPGFFVEIEYLESSKFVLRMKILDENSTLKEARKQSRSIEPFKRTFHISF